MMPSRPPPETSCSDITEERRLNLYSQHPTWRLNCAQSHPNLPYQNSLLSRRIATI